MRSGKKGLTSKYGCGHRMLHKQNKLEKFVMHRKKSKFIGCYDNNQTHSRRKKQACEHYCHSCSQSQLGISCPCTTHRPFYDEIEHKKPLTRSLIWKSVNLKYFLLKKDRVTKCVTTLCHSISSRSHPKIISSIFHLSFIATGDVAFSLGYYTKKTQSKSKGSCK